MNFYDFPVIEHIDDLRKATNSREEFRESQRDEGYISIDYLLQFKDTFPNPNTKDDDLNTLYALRREARGALFCSKTGKIIARRYHKFFNVNERPDTNTRNIDLGQSHRICIKLDGSLITPFKTHDGILRWGTKKGETPVSEIMAKSGCITKNHTKLATKMIKEKITPQFEWCSEKHRIILGYEGSRLLLTDLRYNITGEYCTADYVEKMAKDFDIPYVEPMMTSAMSIKEIVDYTMGLEKEEGFVIKFDNGHAVKIKSQWYTDRHKMIGKIKSEKNVFSLVINEKLDDILPIVSDSDNEKLHKYSDTVFTEILKTADRLKWIAIEAIDNKVSRKKFSVMVEDRRNGFSSCEKEVLYKMYSGQDEAIDVVKSTIKYNMNYRGNNLDKIRPLIGNVIWES